ncbi:unnamed protein product [Arctogadus glacialis]
MGAQPEGNGGGALFKKYLASAGWSPRAALPETTTRPGGQQEVSLGSPPSDLDYRTKASPGKRALIRPDTHCHLYPGRRPHYEGSQSRGVAWSCRVSPLEDPPGLDPEVLVGQCQTRRCSMVQATPPCTAVKAARCRGVTAKVAWVVRRQHGST